MYQTASEITVGDPRTLTSWWGGLRSDGLSPIFSRTISDSYSRASFPFRYSWKVWNLPVILHERAKTLDASTHHQTVINEGNGAILLRHFQRRYVSPNRQANETWSRSRPSQSAIEIPSHRPWGSHHMLVSASRHFIALLNHPHKHSNQGLAQHLLHSKHDLAPSCSHRARFSSSIMDGRFGHAQIISLFRLMLINPPWP